MVRRWRMLFSLSHCLVVLSRKEVPRRIRRRRSSSPRCGSPCRGDGDPLNRCRDGEGAGIVSNQDARMFTVQRQEVTASRVYQRIFGNDVGFHAKYYHLDVVI